MNTEYEQGIDIIDLIIYWMMHYRSLIICIVIGLAVSVAYIGVSKYSGKKNDANSNTPIEKTEYALSEEDKIEVEALAAIYTNYLELLKQTEDLSNLSVAEYAETIQYLAGAYNSINSLRKALSDEQRRYYSSLVFPNEEKVVEVKEVKTVSTKKVILIGLLSAVFLHGVIVIICYIMNGTIKHCDEAESTLGVPGLTKIVNWDSFDRKKGLDKILAGWRYKNIKKISIDEAMKINSGTVIGKEIDNLIIINLAEGSYAEDFKRSIQDNSNISVSLQNSIAYGEFCTDAEDGKKNAILMASAEKTKYMDCKEELKALKLHGIDTVGVMMCVG